MGGSPIADPESRVDALAAVVNPLEEKYRKVCRKAGKANIRIYQVLSVC